MIYFGIDAVLLLVCLMHAPSVLGRAAPPFTVRGDFQLVVDKITVPASAGDLLEGDRIISWNSRSVAFPEMLEFYADQSVIDQRADIGFMRDGTHQRTGITAVAYYQSPRFLFVSFLVGMLTWIVGVFILFQRQKSSSADVLHSALIALAVSIMTTWGRLDASSWISAGTRLLFFLSYAFTPALFLLFVMNYPLRHSGYLRGKSLALISIAASLSILQTYFHLAALYGEPADHYSSFQRWYNIFNIYLLLCYVGMVISLIRSYRRSVRTADKQRLEWILWGFCASPIPFVLFIKLPQLFGITGGLIEEELTTLFFLLIPFSCAISLVQYNLVDIRLVINRSIVYASLTLFAGVIYFLTVLLAVTTFDNETHFKDYLSIGVLIFLIGLILNPARKRIQRLLDLVLFPARVTFRTTTAGIRESLRHCMTVDEVMKTASDHLTKAFPYDSFAMYSYLPDTLVLKEMRGGVYPAEVSLSDEDETAVRSGSVIAASSAFAFQRNDIAGDASSLLERMDGVFCVPLLSKSNTIIGVLTGKSGARSGKFTEEEADLILSLCSDTSQTIDRLTAQEQMIVHQEEKKRAQELSNLKSYFVSSVSHELRTPLTSIRMFAELLRNGNRLSRKRQEEYLAIIEGESSRLTNLVENVLDFASIERGGKEYQLKEINPTDFLQRAAKAMEYQFAQRGSTLKLTMQKKLPEIMGDPEALEQVVINLLSNALKYTLTSAPVSLRAKAVRGVVQIEVADRGIGIPKNELPNIFKNFYRVRHPDLRQIGGAGLGLALVRHIVDAHGGTITVRSIVKKGSTFTVHLPIHKARSL